ncbi:hypothetical protein D3C76_892470 [compost metagenome]
MFKQQQCFWTQCDYLAAQLRTNRTTRSGNHYGVTGNTALQQILLGRHGITSQQVGNVNFLNVVNFHSATGEVHKPRHATHMKRETFEKTENLPTPATRARRHSEQNFLRPSRIDHLLDVFWFVDLQPGNHPIGYARIIVDESNRTHQPTHTQRSDKLVTCSACAINRYLR